MDLLHLTKEMSPEIFVDSRGKAIPLQAWTGPEVSRRFNLPDFKTVDTLKW
jgi:hypothetical protein